MSSNASPIHYYNELEDAFITDANINFDINRKMQVPNKISFTNEANVFSSDSGWNPNQDNLNMKVPERILVAGQNQHIGTRAPPREMEFDNTVLPTEPPANIRVATPPRTLTLDKYPFPHVDEMIEKEKKEEIPVVKPRSKFILNEQDSRMRTRESTPPIGAGGEGLSAPEEVLHLRKQMAKLNRRVMALELENLNRLQKEKIVYGIGIAYFLLKAIFWLGRQ